MPQKAWLGNKVRRMRREKALTQVEMAKRLAISPSYLNLIEHNQRPLTLPLLLKLGQVFNVDLRSFSDNEEARLMAELSELLGEPLFREHDLAREDLKQLVAGSPNACHAMLALFRGYRRAREDARALAERMSEDTYLATSMHELRQLLATIRSFSEILHDYADLEEEQRRQIHEILVRESEKLSQHVDQMRLLAPGGEPDVPDIAGTSVQAVSDLVHEQNNYFNNLEDAAEAFWKEAGLSRDSLAPQLAEVLAEQHAVAVEMTEPHDLPPGAGFDPAQRRLRLPRDLPLPSRLFRMARHLGALRCAEEIDAILAKARLAEGEAQRLGRRLLAGYFAGALLLPYLSFRTAAEETRYDLELLAQRFQVSFEQVCHRLTTLQRPGAEAIPFHFVRVDIAGNISKRYSASGLPLPQYGGACPRWNVHSAFMTPGQIAIQSVVLPDGSRYLMIARTVSKPGRGYGAPGSHYSIAIGCELARARELVYGESLTLAESETAVPVGTTCRLCERENCGQRAFPAVLRALGSVSPEASGAATPRGA